MRQHRRSRSPFTKGIIAIVTGLIVAYAIVCIGLFSLQERLMFGPDPLPANYTFNPKWGRFEEVQLASDGATLSALHFTVPQPKGVVLYFHGNAGSLRDWGAVATTFTHLGYDALMMDYRGYGKSSGQLHTEADFHTDAQVAYDYLRKRYTESQIVIYGRSLGSGIASYLATHTRPRLLILETPYTSFEQIIADRMPMLPISLLLKYPLRTDTWLDQVQCPIALFHGTADGVVPYAHSQQLKGLIKGPHELITVSNGNHGNLAGFAEYRANLARILEQSMRR